MRCFVALGLDGGYRQSLARWLQGASAYRELAISPVENLHLTLAFLGELGDVEVERAGEAVRAAGDVLAAGSTASVVWSAPGVFPSRARARVLWLGVEDADGWFQSVNANLTAELREAGLTLEDRPFRPHLTLARVRSVLPRERAAEVFAHLDSIPIPAPSPVRSLVLYQSKLGGPKAVHAPLVEVPIG